MPRRILTGVIFPPFRLFVNFGFLVHFLCLWFSSKLVLKDEQGDGGWRWGDRGDPELGSESGVDP